MQANRITRIAAIAALLAAAVLTGCGSMGGLLGFQSKPGKAEERERTGKSNGNPIAADSLNKGIAAEDAQRFGEALSRYYNAEDHDPGNPWERGLL